MNFLTYSDVPLELLEPAVPLSLSPYPPIESIVRTAAPVSKINDVIPIVAAPVDKPPLEAIFPGKLLFVIFRQEGSQLTYMTNMEVIQEFLLLYLLIHPLNLFRL